MYPQVSQKPKHNFIKKSISFRVRCLVAVIKVFCWFYLWPFKLYANSVLHSHYFSAFNSFFSIWWLRWVVWKNSFKIIIENNLVNKYSVFSEENIANGCCRERRTSFRTGKSNKKLYEFASREPQIICAKSWKIWLKILTTPWQNTLELICEY